jgi:hypothetical protein
MQAEKPERGEQDGNVAAPEAIEADQHDPDLEQLDPPDEARLLELVGELTGRRREQHERQNEDGAGKVHERVGVERGEARCMERDEDHERVLVDVVVAGAQELRPEERREAALAQESELAGLVQRLVAHRSWFRLLFVPSSIGCRLRSWPSPRRRDAA